MRGTIGLCFCLAVAALKKILPSEREDKEEERKREEGQRESLSGQ